MGAMRIVYKVLVGKPERKRQLERSRHRCEDVHILDLEADQIRGAYDSVWRWAVVNISGFITGGVFLD
jgi:hypothetical protein